MWNNKLGTLNGDRPVMLKVYGSYLLSWHASIGVYALAQSGQPWEAQSYEPYSALTTSTSDTDRYAEPAGSRRSPFVTQVDVNYTQDLKIDARRSVQLVFEVFNIANVQTGFNIQPSVHSPLFGTPQSYYPPRRAQVTARIVF